LAKRNRIPFLFLFVQNRPFTHRNRRAKGVVRSRTGYYAVTNINTGVLIALLLTAFGGWSLADPLISLVIALYIIKSAIGLAHESINVLMDRSLPVEIDRTIAEIVARYRTMGVRGFHDLRTRRSGSQKFIDLHLEVDRDKRFEEAHGLTVRVLRAIEAEIPRSKVHIHSDPVE
jgi:cation diffusion facilitator family transporter